MFRVTYAYCSSFLWPSSFLLSPVGSLRQGTWFRSVLVVSLRYFFGVDLCCNYCPWRYVDMFQGGDMLYFYYYFIFDRQLSWEGGIHVIIGHDEWHFIPSPLRFISLVLSLQFELEQDNAFFDKDFGKMNSSKKKDEQNPVYAEDFHFNIPTLNNMELKVKVRYWLWQVYDCLLVSDVAWMCRICIVTCIISLWKVLSPPFILAI